MQYPDIDYSQGEWPEVLCSKVSGKLADQGLRIDRVPVDVHLEALDLTFESMETPRRIPRLSSGDAVRIEDVGRFVEAYRESIRALDMKLNGRNEHERGVDALMQRYADGVEMEDYDVLIKNAFYTDVDHEPWSEKPEVQDIRLTGWRDIPERVGSDADFIGVDLDEWRIDFEEVKKPSKDLRDRVRDNKWRKASQQCRNFKRTIAEMDTPFEARVNYTASHNYTNSDYLMPDVFDGNLYVLSDLGENTEAVHELQELVDDLAYDSSWSHMDPVERIRADASI